MILPIGKDGLNGYVCPQCDLFLSSQHELTSHLRSHNGVNNSRSEHQCHQCWKILSSSSSLDRHMLTHSGEKPFSCRICKQSFTTNGNMHRHMRTHEKKNEQRRAAILKPKNKSSSSSTSKMDDIFNESIVDVSVGNNNSFGLPPENIEMVSSSQSMLKASTWPPSTQMTNINKKPASCENLEDLNPKPSLSFCQNEGGHDLRLPPNRLPPPKPVLKYSPLPPSSSLPPGPHRPAETSPPRPSLHSSPPMSSPLDSVEFSSSKFPLICIAEGSKNGRRPHPKMGGGGGPQEYGCEDCRLYFPCMKALDLHLATTHYTDQPTCCRVCDLTFSSPENYQQHRSRYHTDGDDKDQAVFMNFLNLISNQNTPPKPKRAHHHHQSSPPPSCGMNGIDDEGFPPLLAKHCHHSSSDDDDPGSFSSPQHEDSDDEDPEDDEESDGMLALPKGDDGGDPYGEPLTDSECLPALNDPHLQLDDSNNNLDTSNNQIVADQQVALNAANAAAKKKASYTCTYCNKDFINTRAAKSHERSHLGLSPYQCKSCSYSSPDKSTLIRHMRTHNGERPYQCKLCNYAFTTKANCERHVKKKHNIVEKEELESKVGVKETKEAQDDAFSSPDTVCKYCNKDFKYFRRLKHHLRGHRSSEEKPFKCKQCDMGFSTKANCVRHIQNKHTDISTVNIENYVQMQESMFTSFMGHSGSPPRCTSAPPPAHSPAVRFSDDSAEDAKPLDLRSSSSRNLSSSQSNSPAVNGGSSSSPFVCMEDLDNNEPIDLSIKRTTKKAIRKMARLADPHTQCPFCDQEFGSELERQYHIKMSHCDQAANPPGDDEDRRFPPILKQPPPPHYGVSPPQGSAAGVSSLLHDHCSTTPLTKKIKMEPVPHKDQSLNINDQSCSDDLASVSQILNTTGANSFEAYFANHEDEDDDDDDDDTVGVLPPLSGGGHQQQMNSYNSSPSEYGNDGGSSQMGGSHIKEEPHDLEDSEFGIRVAADEEDGHLNNSSDSKDMAARQEQPEGGGDSSQKSPKKKRNSYADSPHKLKCPHCPRHFPWASSLNRHILTHTGEKPFECPKCHVIFSTKSNRERHLTRKHGVNMLDPAARQTMDRPFKCHLCTFSSFATKGFPSLENLVRHYRDRHPDDPLPEMISEGGGDKPSGSGSSPNPQQKTKFHPGSDGNNIHMELESPQSAEKTLSDECGSISSSKRPERANPFRDDDGTKEDGVDLDEEDDDDDDDDDDEEINNNNNNNNILHHWTTQTQKQQQQTTDDLQGGGERGNTTVHTLTPHHPKSHLCYTCGYGTSTPRLLQEHARVHHSKDLPPFRCHICDTSFHERLRCLRHLERAHSAEWSALWSTNNRNHRIEEGLEPFSDAVGRRCKECVEALLLSDRVEPNSHMTQYLDRKVYCAFCTERFWSSQDLRHHMQSHTTVCQLSKKESTTHIPSNVSETDTLLVPTTLPRGCSDYSATKTEEPDILPTMLGMDASSIDRLLDSAMAGGRLSTYIP